VLNPREVKLLKKVIIWSPNEAGFKYNSEFLAIHKFNMGKAKANEISEDR
jgi:hypothetical protein